MVADYRLVNEDFSKNGVKIENKKKQGTGTFAEIQNHKAALQRRKQPQFMELIKLAPN